MFYYCVCLDDVIQIMMKGYGFKEIYIKTSKRIIDENDMKLKLIEQDLINNFYKYIEICCWYEISKTEYEEFKNNERNKSNEKKYDKYNRW